MHIGGHVLVGRNLLTDAYIAQVDHRESDNAATTLPGQSAIETSRVVRGNNATAEGLAQQS